MSVDWSRPIEAVHDDGRVVPVQRFIGLNGTNVMPTLDGGWFSFCEDGRHSFSECPWRIRNVAKPAPTPDELTKRMEAHLRNVVAKFSDVAEGRNPELDEARAIVALLPAPVDPDLVEARDLVRMAYPDVKDNYQGRRLDIALAAIKRGRALERGEG